LEGSTVQGKDRHTIIDAVLIVSFKDGIVGLAALKLEVVEGTGIVWVDNVVGIGARVNVEHVRERKAYKRRRDENGRREQERKKGRLEARPSRRKHA
jgi:hypothetical protein